MILTFKDAETEKVYATGKSRKLGLVARVAARRLAVIDFAKTLSDLREPPGNRLEAPGGDHRGQHSIRINDQYRVCFRWNGKDAADIEIVTTTRRGTMAARKKLVRLVAIHPGEFLREDFLKPLGLSVNALALALRVPATRIAEIVNERRGITTDTALRLSRYFGTTPDFWIHMQAAYELAIGENELLPKIEKEVQRRVA